MTQLMTTKDIAKMMQVTELTIRRWVGANKIPFTKLPGGDLRFDESKIQNWINNRTAKARQ